MKCIILVMPLLLTLCSELIEAKTSCSITDIAGCEQYVPDLIDSESHG